ncbi:MAG: cell division protein ZapA [Selenomonadaceae bacterium]|nr:cell division protein ZapA [Selenomonadaceae bacterium]
MANPNEKKSDAQHRVEVDIFGEVYRLKTDDQDCLAKCVRMVDSTMKSIAQNTRTFAGSRIAVLAALQIAEDYMQLKNDYDELLSLLNEHK